MILLLQYGSKVGSTDSDNFIIHYSYHSYNVGGYVAYNDNNPCGKFIVRITGKD